MTPSERRERLANSLTLVQHRREHLLLILGKCGPATASDIVWQIGMGDSRDAQEVRADLRQLEREDRVRRLCSASGGYPALWEVVR